MRFLRRLLPLTMGLTLVIACVALSSVNSSLLRLNSGGEGAENIQRLKDAVRQLQEILTSVLATLGAALIALALHFDSSQSPNQPPQSNGHANDGGPSSAPPPA